MVSDMATTLGEYTLPDPVVAGDGHDTQYVGEGTFLTMADGSIVYDYGTARRRISMAWRGMTGDQYNTLHLAYTTKTTQLYEPPDGTAKLSVFIVPNTWRCRSFEVGTSTPYYDISFAVEEISKDTDEV
jgi:hypothetical protein